MARTWSRRARTRRSKGTSLPSFSSAYSSATLPESWRQAASMSLEASATRTLVKGSSLAFSPA
ncbi:Uncharacterised protein [Mycobacteroides abscessus subsp. abscessus]|nr:Uncharacterised protein [Mycobacteroides abscessus subsp. abscessus]